MGFYLNKITICNITNILSSKPIHQNMDSLKVLIPILTLIAIARGFNVNRNLKKDLVLQLKEVLQHNSQQYLDRPTLQKVITTLEEEVEDCNIKMLELVHKLSDTTSHKLKKVIESHLHEYEVK